MFPSNLPGLRAPASISAIKHAPISSTLLLTNTVTNGRSLPNHQVIAAPPRRGCHWHNRRSQTWLSQLDPLFQYYARRRHRSMKYRLIQALRRKSSWERDENDWGWRMPSSWIKNGPYARWTDQEGFTSSKTDRAKRDVDDVETEKKNERKGESEEGEGYELSDREIRWKKRMDEVRVAIERDPFGALFGKKSYMPPRDWIRGIFPGIWSDIEAWKAKIELEAMQKAETDEMKSSKPDENSKMKVKSDKPSMSVSTNPSAVKQTLQAAATPDADLEYDPITMRMIPKNPEKQESTQQKQKLQKAQDEAIDIPVKKYVDRSSQPGRTPNDTIPSPLVSQQDASRSPDSSAAARPDYDDQGTTGKQGPTSSVSPMSATPEVDNGHPLARGEAGPQPPYPVVPALKEYDSHPDGMGGTDPSLLQNSPAMTSSGVYGQLTLSGKSGHSSTQDTAPVSSEKYDSRYYEIEQSVDKAINAQVDAGLETAKDAKALPTSWLAREGFGSPVEQLPSLDSLQTTRSSVDPMEEHSKEPALPGKYAGSKAINVQTPEAVQTSISKPTMPVEDLDVLRASDVRATMGLTKKLDKDHTEQWSELIANLSKYPGTAQRLDVLRKMMIQVNITERRIMLARKELSLLKELPKHHPLRTAPLRMDFDSRADMGDLYNKQRNLLSAIDSTKTKGEAKAQELNTIKDIVEKAKQLSSELAASQRRMEQAFRKLLLARGTDVSRRLLRKRLGIKSPAEKLEERKAILNQTNDPDDNSLQSQNTSFERRLERKRLGIEEIQEQPEIVNFGRIARAEPDDKPSGPIETSLQRVIQRLSIIKTDEPPRALETSLQRGLGRRRLIIKETDEHSDKQKPAATYTDSYTTPNLSGKELASHETSLQPETERQRLGIDTASKLRRGGNDVSSAAGVNGPTLLQRFERLNALRELRDRARRKLEAAVKAQETKLYNDEYAPEPLADEKSYARKVAAGRKLEEEIKAHQAAMQRFEHGGYYNEQGRVHNLSERKIEACRPGGEKTLEGELAAVTHEGTVSPKSVNFTSGKALPTNTPASSLPADRPTQSLPTNRLSQPSTEEIAKQEQRERDRNLYREVRDIYEKAYGVIDTKHQQGAILKTEDRGHKDVHKALVDHQRKEQPSEFTPGSLGQESVTKSRDQSEAQSRLSDDCIIAPGYDIVHKASDLVILKKKSPGKEPLNGVVSRVNPIDGTTIGNFASPTGFVNHEPPILISKSAPLHAATNAASEPSPTSTTTAKLTGAVVRRQEPVFSGQRRGWPRHGRRREGRKWGRFRRAMRSTLLLGVWTAACCYAVGVVAEYFRTGGSTGLGPQGF